MLPHPRTFRTVFALVTFVVQTTTPLVLATSTRAKGTARTRPPLGDAAQQSTSPPPSEAQPPAAVSTPDALKKLREYAAKVPAEGQSPFGPSIQFDTKGVDFGPWIRRFKAQVYRNWFVPQDAMSLHGHVVITFHVHKNGALTDVSVVQPSSVDSFTSAAAGSLIASNPTEPLPPEYPSDKCFFTVTFYYNERLPEGP